MDNPYQAPRGEILTPSGGQNPLTWKEILFSFKGRIPRRQYWGGIGILILSSVPIGLIIFAIGDSKSAVSIAFVAIIGIVAYIALIWASFALGIKRWHDRDKSGWWMLIGFIPIIGGMVNRVTVDFHGLISFISLIAAIWSFVEQGCLRGTEGPNRFGDDPT